MSNPNSHFLKGQSSIEFLTVFGIAMLMASPFIISAETSINELRTSTETAQLENSLNKLQETVQTVASQGEPAKRTIEIDLPRNVQTSYLVNEQAIVYTYRVQGQNANTSRIFENPVQETGEGLPNQPGRHQIEVEAWQGQVNLSRVQ